MWHRLRDLVAGLALLVGICPLALGADPEPPSRPRAVCAMWLAPLPDASKPAAGFPQLEDVRVATVFRPGSQREAYNHCPELTWFAGQWHAMWINHPEGEDLPGQRVLYSASADASHWPPPRELYPPPGELKMRSPDGKRPRGPRTKAYAWYESGGKLYAVAGCYDHWPSDLVPIAREVQPDGRFGPIFALEGAVKVSTSFKVLTADEPSIAAAAARLLEKYRTPIHWPTQSPIGWNQPTVDGTRLWEPSVYRTSDGYYVATWRCKSFNHRLYTSLSTDGRNFPPAGPTDIPDSPSLTRSLTLADGRVLLVGNQVATGFDNPQAVQHYPRDPLTVAVSANGYGFEKVYALRWGAPPLRFKGTGGRGFQYPSIAVREDRLFVLHTVGKEDVAMASVALAEIGAR